MALTGPTRVRGQTKQVGINRQRVGDYNQRLVFQIIRAMGTTTCAEIGTEAGLSHQAAINIVKRLSNDKLVAEDGKTSGQRGQPAALLKVNPKGAFALGLNVDRDHVTLVVMDLLGAVQYRASLKQALPLPGEVLDFLKSEITNIFSNKVVPKSRIIGMGIAIPDGISNVPHGKGREGFGEWKTTDFAALCAKTLRLPVYIENDATAAAIGEFHVGHGANHNSFLYVLISAGLGCGLIIDGKPYSRGKNHAGEIGNIPLQSATGEKRTLNDTVSIFSLYTELSTQGIAIEKIENIDPEKPLVQEVVEKWTDRVVEAMLWPFLTINYTLSPEINYIGGQLPEFVVQKLCVKLNAAVVRFETFKPVTLFQPSSTSVDASALGAAFLVFKNLLLP